VLATNARFRDPARLFESTDIGLVLDYARLEYDVILIDCPPLLQTPEASIIAGIADASLLVGRAGELTRDDAHHALERLATANAQTLGVIVSDARERRSSYGYGNEDELS
jgi:polysaccharide biosynthesis transport protein